MMKQLASLGFLFYDFGNTIENDYLAVQEREHEKTRIETRFCDMNGRVDNKPIENLTGKVCI